MSKASEIQRYLLALGEMLARFLELETALRKYLHLHDAAWAVEEWDDVAKLGHRVKFPETAFTSGDSFGMLVERYNASFATQGSRRKYAIDDSIVSTRNTLVHGRVFHRPKCAVPALVNFSPRKKRTKDVFVEAVIHEPGGWVEDKLPKITAQLARVQAASTQLHRPR